MWSFSELVSRYMSSSSLKRSNPPPKLALSTAAGANNSTGTGNMDGQDDGTVLTTPDIQGTVTTPGMIEMLGRNGNTFNQFSLAPITSSTMGHTTQTIPTMTQSPQYPQSAATSIKREPSEDKNYVELDTPHKIPTVQQMQTNNPQSVNAMAIPNMTTSVVPVNMDEQERQKLERKRERNRLAATKCRQRKIQKINVLEQEVQVLTERNNNLKNERRHLREELQRLESQLGIPNNSAQIYA